VEETKEASLDSLVLTLVVVLEAEAAEDLAARLAAKMDAGLLAE
jgi:hypothetical protein